MNEKKPLSLIEKKLQEALRQHTKNSDPSLNQVAFATGIPYSTLHTFLNKDDSMRMEYYELITCAIFPDKKLDIVPVDLIETLEKQIRELQNKNSPDVGKNWSLVKR